MTMTISKDNNPQSVFENHFSLKCAHCGVLSNVSATSIPRYEYLDRFRPRVVGIGYRCDSCNYPVFLRFNVFNYVDSYHRVELDTHFEEVERPKETFEFQYLPDEVEQDFREALISYSNSCFNAFAAMCRRCVQSISAHLGAKGKDKVLKQLQDLKEMAEIDEETFDILKQIIIDGHDGAHPHLPSLNVERASILLELIKDVLYQIYVRKGKLQEAMKKRQQAIDKNKLT